MSLGVSNSGLVTFFQALGALGTPIIAFMVYRLSKTDSARAKERAIQTHNLERSRFKFDLVDRRLDLINRLQKAYYEALLNDSSNECFDTLNDLSNLAHIIFSKELADRIFSMSMNLRNARAVRVQSERAAKNNDESFDRLDERHNELMNKVYDDQKFIFDGLVREARIDLT